MEQQLQDILASLNQDQSLILSQSLDASSPEGRDTWMMLGKRLKVEGITSKQIQKHSIELVNAIKTTIGQLSSPESYETAPEYFGRSHEMPHSVTTSVPDGSIASFGSGPQRGALFPSQLTANVDFRSKDWTAESNIQCGVTSLLRGLESRDTEDTDPLSLDTSKTTDVGDTPSEPSEYEAASEKTLSVVK
ncbi:uncharacterized protein KY384_007183 [Bacidia gigantensis]|uniref:uncharacterized protein n=1 Tax=Bacidia gigantensis TaxID=2732470 RepID=UPI001D0420FE|nr:uncharacterized protein KY384_007183 [Bacidia gigantensis]KAG8528266.1 hypothetical protein KY384_007183 [Bacidia gigantensis]